MDVELLPVATVPVGLVSSTLLNTTVVSQRHSDEDQTEVPSSRASEVLVSLCPTGRVMVFIFSYKAQFVFTDDSPSAADPGHCVPYQTSYEGLLHVTREPSKPRPFATAVVVIPVMFENRSGSVQNSSVVAVGFSDGFIRTYSKSGIPVFSQLLHNEPVVRMTCMAPAPGQRKMDDTQNLVVLFKSAVCVIEGRSFVEVVKANAAKRNEGDSMSSEEVPSLGYKKWHLQDQSTTMDVAFLSESTPSIFDHLCEASNVGGFETIVKSAPSPKASLIAVGEQPMIALYRITKDAGTVNVSEVVSAVASKMTSAVLGKLTQASGWLGWGSSAIPQPKPVEEKMALASNISMSTNVPDDRRSVNSIVVSPLGNLAAAVDCFGRVLLLDSQEMVIRRMWKGYRDAQCGWLLVHEATTPPQSGKKAHKTSPEGLKKAQCLCIYAPRRGIVELWPVESGTRIAVIPVGKGCRLLYSPHGVFTADSTSGKGRGRGRGVRDCSLLLCPNGQVVTFSVPFPTLTRVDDARSHDAHLLQKLPQALQSGDTDLVLQLFSSFKSSQSMKEAADRLISAHPLQDVPPDFTVKVLNLILTKIDQSEPMHQELLQYIAGVNQLVQLTLAVEELSSDEDMSPPSPDKLHELLSTLCGMPQEPAQNTGAVLGKYFNQFVAKKRVIKIMELRDVVGCFNLPQKVGHSVILTVPASGESLHSTKVPLHLREKLSVSTMLDIGCSIFMTLITADVPEYEVRGLFQNCGISLGTLLSLLCRVFLNASYKENNPCMLLRRLHRVLSIISSDMGGSEEAVEMWSDVCQQCANTHNVGHALLVALLCLKITSPEPHATEEEEDSMEAWETVTPEKEQWVRLLHHLDTLALLSTVVGQKAMGELPPILFVFCGEGEADTEEPDVSDLQVQLLNKDEKYGVCAAALEAAGSALIVQCVSRWLVENEVPANLVAQMPIEPHSVQDSGHSKTVFLLGPLLKLLPHSLSGSSLLVHCAWQATYVWKDNPQNNSHLHRCVLHYISHVPNISLLRGLVGFLWCYVYEKSIVRVLDVLRRGAVSDVGTIDLVSVCRNLFGYLYQVSHIESTEEEPVESVRDVLLIQKPMGMMFLVDILQVFPSLGMSVVKTYFELHLHLEIALQLKATVNVVAFFPTWLRGALKKSVFKVAVDAKQENVPAQLQQKRTKFLCEAVRACVGSTGPKMSPTVSSEAIKKHQVQSPTVPHLEAVEFSDFIFHLSDIWTLNTDGIKQHWVSHLFAAGLGDHGKEAFHSINDKTKASHELLGVAGCLADHLIHGIEIKSERLALMAQISPSLLEWLRKQSSGSVAKTCSKLDPTWKALAQLVALIQPYLSDSSSGSSIVLELLKVIELTYRQEPL